MILKSPKFETQLTYISILSEFISFLENKRSFFYLKKKKKNTISQEGTLLLQPVARTTASKSSDLPSTNSAPCSVNRLIAGNTCSAIRIFLTIFRTFLLIIRSSNLKLLLISIEDLDVSGSDLCEGANVEDGGLAGERLELQRAEPGPREPEPGRVAEHQTSHEEEHPIHCPHGQPLEEPH